MCVFFQLIITYFSFSGIYKMKAVGLYKYLPIDDPQSLVDLDILQPNHPTTGHDLLVAVKAISVNPVDTKVRRGMIPPLTHNRRRRKRKKYSRYIRMGCCWRSSRIWFRLHTFRERRRRLLCWQHFSTIRNKLRISYSR